MIVSLFATAALILGATTNEPRNQTQHTESHRDVLTVQSSNFRLLSFKATS